MRGEVAGDLRTVMVLFGGEDMCDLFWVWCEGYGMPGMCLLKMNSTRLKLIRFFRVRNDIKYNYLLKVE